MDQTLPTVNDRYTDDEVKRFYEEGFWTSETLTELLDSRAAERPDTEFVSDATTSLTFAQLRDRAWRTAAGLARSGIGPGDRVVVQLPNWSDFVVVVAALARLGAIVVPVMPIYRHDEVRYVLQHSGARAAVTCEEFGGFSFASMYADIRGDCPALEAVYLARADRPFGDAQPLDSLVVGGDLEAISDELGPGPSADDGHLIVYTSGTTARPKGCFHTFNTLSFTVRTMAENLRWTDADVNFGPSPVTHSTGYMTSVLIPLFAKGRTHLMEAWDPKAAFDRIAEHRCTTAVTATVFLQMLVDAYQPDEHDASSLRLWVAAGSPIPAAVVEKARRILPGLEVLSLYGRSENMVTTMCNAGDDPQLSTTSDGHPPRGVEVMVVDDQGGEVPAGQQGDLAYRGPGHMLGYFGNPELTAELFTAEGFSRSGDLGFVNEAGCARVTGRLKDIIIRGGMNISAREVEELLLGSPNVRDVAVVAMPDERLGEKVCAYIVAAEGSQPTLADVSAYLRDEHHVATQKIPERVELVDALPMTATGKVQKHLLRADVAGKLERDGTTTSVPG
ncbi:MAG: AMP-binding protein, partial [Ilumatobacteraceae bacterium]